MSDRQLESLMFPVAHEGSIASHWICFSEQLDFSVRSDGALLSNDVLNVSQPHVFDGCRRECGLSVFGRVQIDLSY